MSGGELIGRRGQKAFDLLCSECGLICNAAHEDLAGWDFIVHSPLDSAFSGTLDKRPASIDVLVQVKTAQKELKSIKIKLSNAERMVKEAKPTFFAIGLESKITKKITFKMGHVGEKAIAFVLESLRKASNENDTQINRKILSLPVATLDISPIASASDLLDVIKFHVRGSLESYIKKKLDTIKTLATRRTP